MLYKKRNESNYSDNQIKDLEKAYNLWIRLNERNLYEMVGSLVTDNKIENTLINPNILCYQTKIGYVSGTKTNPLSDIYFYNCKDSLDKCYKITKDNNSFHSSHLVSDIYQEYITMYFIKDKEDIKTKNELKKFIEYICI